MPLVKWFKQIIGLSHYAYQQTLKKYLNALHQPMPDLQRISELTAYLLSKSMKLKSVGVLVLDRTSHQYVVRAAEGEADPLLGTSFPSDNKLFLVLFEKKKEIQAREVQDETLRSQMQKLKSELCIPVISQLKYFSEPTLLGVVFLGPMLSGDKFTSKDIRFFFNLIKQAGSNLDTA